jgi:hypothetical protein
LIDRMVVPSPDPDNNPCSDYDEFVENLCRSVELAHVLTSEMYEEFRVEKAVVYNRHRLKAVVYKVNDLVLVKNFALSSKKDGVSAKLLSKYFGPFSISEVISPLIVKVNRVNNKGVFKVVMYHVKDIKIYSGRKGNFLPAIEHADYTFCASSDCVGNLTDWVMCDGCGMWYHVECENISLETASSLAVFYCSKCLSGPSLSDSPLPD